jgi:hypothetical protein
MLLLMIYRKGKGQPGDFSAVYFEEVKLKDKTRPTFVPPVKIPPRAPFGPSEVLNAGIPFEGMDLDLQKSAATKSETFAVLALGRRWRTHYVELTCSSSESDAARLRTFARLSTGLPSTEFVLGGLSGGDISDLGVVLSFLLDRPSSSSPNLSKMGSWTWLSGESVILRDGRRLLVPNFYRP